MDVEVYPMDTKRMIIDEQLPVYDVVIAEHVIETADTSVEFALRL